MIKLLSLFSGIGSFEKALNKLDIDYELVNYCEVDKYASKSYCAIHGVNEDLNLWDVTKINTSYLPKDIDLITYGFPCQDISLAGKMKGFDDNGEMTRSGLFFEALRIIEDTQPKVAIAENVKNLLSKKFKKEFEIVLDSLEQAGYNNYWKVMNAKDYGIPQNRERVFIVSIRKDVDTGMFKFPEGFELKLRLKDILENEVDEKYYLSDKLIEGFTNHKKRHLDKGTGFIWKPKTGDEVANCLRANASLCPTDNSIIVCGEVNIGNNESNNRVYSSEGISPTLNSMQGGHRQPKILWTETQSKMITEDGNVKRYINSNIIDEFKEDQAADISFPNGYNKANRVHETMPSLNNTTTKSSFIYKESQEPLRIRKLTPKECWRLQGYSDEDFEKAENVNSNTQLYKQAGNSIVVNVLEELFKKLFKDGELFC